MFSRNPLAVPAPARPMVVEDGGWRTNRPPLDPTLLDGGRPDWRETWTRPLPIRGERELRLLNEILILQTKHDCGEPITPCELWAIDAWDELAEAMADVRAEQVQR